MPEDLVHLAERAAVDVIREHDMIARAQLVQHAVHRGEAARECEPDSAPFECREIVLERLPRGILAACVVVAVLENTRRFLHERAGHVDRSHDRAGGRVGLLAGVDAVGTETVGFLRHTGFL